MQQSRVHIVINGAEYSLWFGEAKFFNSLNDANFYQITNSLYNALQVDKLKKENSIILGVRDLQSSGLSEDLIQKITRDLSPKNSIDNIKKIINVPIMVIHECDITKDENNYSESYIDNIKNMYLEKVNSYYFKQYNKLSTIHLYDLIKFHLILFPVPEKKKIVDKFIKQVEFYKEEAED